MSEFELASRRAAACLVLVETVARHGKAGNVDDAYRTLQTLIAGRTRTKRQSASLASRWIFYIYQRLATSTTTAQLIPLSSGDAPSCCLPPAGNGSTCGKR